MSDGQVLREPEKDPNKSDNNDRLSESDNKKGDDTGSSQAVHPAPASVREADTYFKNANADSTRNIMQIALLQL